MSAPTVASPEVEKELSRAKVELMSKPDTAFFTHVLFRLKFEWDDTIKTAQTNGIGLKMNPNFFMSLDREERVFLLVHEAMHVAYLHGERLKDRDHGKWNVATDHYINLSLIDRNFKMPIMGLADPAYRGLSSDEIYALLPDNQQESMDEVTMTLGDLGEFRKEVEDILVQAKIQSELEHDAPGTIPGDIQIFLNKLLKPKLPWEKILRNFIRNVAKTDYSNRRFNRRYLPEFYIPSLHSDKLMDIAIAVDTSGSVTDAEFKVFVSEISGLLKQMNPDKISIVQFDSQIKSVDTVKSLQDLSQVRFCGRGGTRINPVIDWAEENKPQLLLVFSDGYFDFYERTSKIKTAWVIHDNPLFNPPYGKTIHYSVEN